MPGQNVDKLRGFLEAWDPRATLEAWKRGEADVSLLDPEVAYEDTILPDHVGETYHGYEGVARATERWLEPFETLTVELERIVGAEDRLVSVHRVQMKARAVRKAYDAMNQGDWDAAFRDAHPNFEMTLQRALGAGGTLRGREAVQGFIQDYVAAFDSMVFEPEEFLENGDQVVVLLTRRARPKGGSGELVVQNGHIWKVHDGTTLSMKSFPDPEEALEAAGLRE